MSSHRLVLVNCDHCTAGLDYDAWSSTAAETRAEARAAGWHRANGRDVCPECWADGAR